MTVPVAQAGHPSTPMDPSKSRVRPTPTTWTETVTESDATGSGGLELLDGLGAEHSHPVFAVEQSHEP
jgi:hypothetical protein